VYSFYDNGIISIEINLLQIGVSTMRITLEMVDEVINRTGVTYKEAKEVLELYDGDLLKAIVHIEEQKTGASQSSGKTLNGQEIVDKLKALVNEGFINQITIVKSGKVVVDIPIMAGAIGAVIFTIPTVAAIVAAVATGCEIKIVKKDGEVLNINEMTQDKFDELKSVFKEKEKESQSSASSPAEEDAEEDIFEEEESEKY